MKIVFYERACSGCAIARRFLTKNDVSYESIDVRKKPVSPAETLKMVRRFKKIYGVIGKKVVSYDVVKDKPSEDDLKKILIGRSGTLRAPCFEVGDTFVGGFNPELYKKLIKQK